MRYLDLVGWGTLAVGILAGGGAQAQIYFPGDNEGPPIARVYEDERFLENFKKFKAGEQEVYFGKPVGPNAFPGVVALLGEDVSGKTTLCTGSLIRPRIILTAAHCTGPNFGPGTRGVSEVSDADGTSAGAQASQRQPYLSLTGPSIDAPQEQARVIASVRHPSYDGQSGRGLDLALLLLARDFSDRVPLGRNRAR